MRTFLSIRQMAEIVGEAASKASPDWEYDRDVTLYVKFNDEEQPYEFGIYSDSFVGKNGSVPHLYHNDWVDVLDQSFSVLVDQGCLYGCTAMWFEVELWDTGDDD